MIASARHLMATIGSLTHTHRPPVADPTAAIAGRGVQRWLYTLALLVFAMVVIGGATRLTGSGLSITEWQPIVGTLPPLSDAAWLEAFSKYQQIPQYQTINKGISLEAFKAIFWWEWGHRLLGRLIGVVFLLPFLGFLLRGSIDRPLAWRLSVLFALGGLQGALGWYMVKSGLSVRTDVSQYRLAAHLLAASALMAALLWTAIDIGSVERRRRIRLRTLAQGSTTIAGVILALVFLQIGAGALVAGMKAGLAYNTWPLMDGHLVPAGLAAMSPVWANAFENAATVQFDHRLIAYVLAALVIWQGVRVRTSADDERMTRSAAALVALVVMQFALGIWTLVSHVPLHLALAHQASAMLVLAAAVWHLHTLVRE